MSFGQAVAADFYTDLRGGICTGYHQSLGSWGQRSTNAANYNEFLCDHNHVINSVVDPPGNTTVPGDVEVVSVCCPLPHSDILTDHHGWIEDECPFDSIVTGARRQSKTDGSHLHELRCTRINSERYQLGPILNGQAWGFSSSALYLWRRATPLKFTDIPVALRYGIARMTHNDFATSGCIGDPIGSVLVGKKGTTCEQFKFRALLYSGSDENLESRRVVPMYPECRALSDVFSTTPYCDDTL